MTGSGGIGVRVIRTYFWILGLSLLAQGGISLTLRVVGVVAPGPMALLLNADPLHATVHIAWGVVLIVAALAVRPNGVTYLAIIFGVFYTALAVAGVLIRHPFGMLLGVGENGFHFIVGPLSLFLGLSALRRGRARANGMRGSELRQS